MVLPPQTQVNEVEGESRVIRGWRFRLRRLLKKPSPSHLILLEEHPSHKPSQTP